MAEHRGKISQLFIIDNRNTMKTPFAYALTMAISIMGQAPEYKDPELDPNLNPNLRGAVAKEEGPAGKVASEVVAAAVEVKSSFAEAALKAQELLAKSKTESVTADAVGEAAAPAKSAATEVVAAAASAAKSATSEIVVDAAKSATSDKVASAAKNAASKIVTDAAKSATAEIVADAAPAKSESTSPAALTDPKTVEVKRSVKEDEKHDGQKSKRRFIKYESSYWERLWLEQVDVWAKDHKICEILLGEQAQLVHDFLNGTCTSRYLPPHDSWCMIDDEYRPLWYNSGNRDEFELSSVPPLPMDAQITPPKPVIPTEENEEIFSTFTFKDEETGEIYAEYIEPLVSHLRFPLTHCIEPTPNEPAYTLESRVHVEGSILEGGKFWVDDSIGMDIISSFSHVSSLLLFRPFHYFP